MDEKGMGSIFLGCIFILIAIYIFIAVDSFAGRLFGGGFLVILGFSSIVSPFGKYCEPKKKQIKRRPTKKTPAKRKPAKKKRRK